MEVSLWLQEYKKREKRDNSFCILTIVGLKGIYNILSLEVGVFLTDKIILGTEHGSFFRKYYIIS